MARKIIALIGAITALGLVASASVANGSTLLFAYSETGPHAIDVSWNQLSNPTPIAYNFDTYTTVPVFNWMGNIGPFTSITYDSVVFTNGGFYTPDGAILVSHLQLYGFPESSPSFAPSVWAGANEADGLPFTLTITTVPEPAAWAVMLVGLGGLGATMRVARRARRGRAGPVASRVRAGY